MPDALTSPTGNTDFFISYRGAHTAWARWINWVVRSAGYSTVLMDEFPTGTDWTDQMREAAQNCHRLIPLYSADYWGSGACMAEFDAYWRQHLKNSKARFLLPLVIEKCTAPDIHEPLLAKRLYELDRDSAQQAIVKVLTGIVPVTSGLGCTEAEPPFPGLTAPAVAAEWPETAPDNFRWPLADHGEARLAFATLVTRSATGKLLAIRGESETGKSHLTRQFLTNAQRRLPGCAAGRFDFKGTTDIAGGLRSFADQLAAPPPPEGDLAHRLSALVRSLGQRPALLIFDGYEFAGEADRWVRESLLTNLHRSPWLRVILAGQKVPDCHGHGWEEDSHIITLAPPNPDDWLTYALENKRSVDLDIVTHIHTLARGRASAIAPLLGPAA